MKRTSKTIVEMTSEEAKKFLLKRESYINSSLPSYFNINEILKIAIESLNNNTLVELSKSRNELSKHEKVNHEILSNKDGNYAWRPIQLIHPIVYVDLVNSITDENNWITICNRLKAIYETSKVECISLPIESHSEKSDKAEVILNWWENLEQAQIKHSIDYMYCGHTDISNCYDSMYTHTIPWAIHTKSWAKAHRKASQGIGNKIDSKIQYMRNAQTNGIPQGSVLMDFIAEIVLGYADSLLTDKLKSVELSNFHIMRYRDDYRVFSNNKDQVDKIIKILAETLAEINLKLNSSKTFISNDIITDAIKADKLYWNVRYSSFTYKTNDEISFQLSIQKHLIQIKILSDMYPHSGSIKRALMDIYKYRINELSKTPKDINQLVSIIIDIMVKNPNAIEHCVVILSKLITLIKKERIPEIIDKILLKFDSIPNTNFVELWLQRLSVVHNRDKKYESGICKKVESPDTNFLWNSKWLTNGFDESKLIDEDYIDNMDITMSPIEIDLFANIYEMDDF